MKVTLVSQGIVFETVHRGVSSNRKQHNYFNEVELL